MLNFESKITRKWCDQMQFFFISDLSYAWYQSFSPFWCTLKNEFYMKHYINSHFVLPILSPEKDGAALCLLRAQWRDARLPIREWRQRLILFLKFCFISQTVKECACVHCQWHTHWWVAPVSDDIFPLFLPCHTQHSGGVCGVSPWRRSSGSVSKHSYNYIQLSDYMRGQGHLIENKPRFSTAFKDANQSYNLLKTGAHRHLLHQN